MAADEASFINRTRPGWYRFAHALAAADLPKRISKTDVKRNRSTLAALASLGEGEFTALADIARSAGRPLSVLLLQVDRAPNLPFRLVRR